MAWEKEFNPVVAKNSQSTASSRAATLVRFAVTGLALLLSLFVASAAQGHAGIHPPGFDGRIPGMPDLKKVGDTTYRYLPDRGVYRIERPGSPTAFTHWDPPAAQGGLLAESSPAAGEGEEGGPIPVGKLKPPCVSPTDTFSSRVVVVYAHSPSETKPVPTQELREAMEKINWTFRHESMLASENQIELQLPVECDEAGEIAVHDVISGDDFSTIRQAVVNKLGEPKGYGKAVKWLVFYRSGTGGGGGLGEWLYSHNKSSNVARNTTSALAVAYGGSFQTYGTRYTPLHELLHTMGASDGYGWQNPLPPFATTHAHCTDGRDVLCYPDGSDEAVNFTNNRCPEEQMRTEERAWVIDCGGDTYFDPTAEPGEYLSQYWNIGEKENAFLRVPPPAVTTNAAGELSATGATLKGTVNPKGEATNYYFEYGRDSVGFESSTATTSAGAGGAVLSVSQLITGLTPGVKYRYRLVAVRNAGNQNDATVVGSTLTFTAGGASTLSIDKPVEFLMSSGASSWSQSGQNWSCNKAGSGSGQFTSGTSGTMTLTFNECYGLTGFGKIYCTTPGQAKGTIKTSTLSIKPVYLDAAHNEYGLLLSPPESGVFADFSCAGGLWPGGWKGSLIGRITNPALNVLSTEHTLWFSQSGGVQQYQQVEGSGPLHYLTRSGAAVGIGSTQTMKFSTATKYVP